MNQSTIDFLIAKQINSFQKLRFLLFLHRFPGLRGTIEEFAEILHFGDRLFVEKIVADFKEVGLLKVIDNRYTLNTDPITKRELDRLATDFNNPLTRQNLLDQVRRGAISYGRPANNGYYPGRHSVTGF